MVAIFAESNDERSVDCTAILIDLDHTMSGDASISDLPGSGKSKMVVSRLNPRLLCCGAGTTPIEACITDHTPREPSPFGAGRTNEYVRFYHSTGIYTSQGKLSNTSSHRTTVTSTREVSGTA